MLAAAVRGSGEPVLRANFSFESVTDSGRFSVGLGDTNQPPRFKLYGEPGRSPRQMRRGQNEDVQYAEVPDWRSHGTAHGITQAERPR